MSATQDLNNPDLFKENPPGEYTYTENGLGKTASGQLVLSENPQRDSKAQREAGGEDRRVEGGFWGKDDGGHLIGARFDGATDDRNLTPQNSNLNRGAYKQMENSWAEHLEAGDKVYVHMESYSGNDSQRPSAYMGYAIIEHTDEQGKTTREIEYYSMNNESFSTMEALDEEAAAFQTEHPEYVETEREKNTTMQFVWDEEKQDVVDNPCYCPENQQTETKSEYAPAETQNSITAANDYAPAAASEMQQTAMDYAPTVVAESTPSQSTSAGMESSVGAEQDQEV